MKQRFFNKKFKGLMLFILVFSCFNTATFSQEKSNTSPDEKQQAEQLWEQMIEAKGGREKLHSINNLMWSTGEEPDNTVIYLEVYPNKHWDWVGLKSFHNTMWVRMSNMENCVSFTASYQGLLGSDKFSKETCQSIRMRNIHEATIFLLETKWLQPKPIRVTRQKIKKEEFDVVETLIPANSEGHYERMDFYIDPKSLLVQRVLEYYKGNPSGFNAFEEYISVDGIKMPSRRGSYFYSQWNKKIKLKSSTKLKWDFNIEYNEQIFEKPPSVEAGMDAWKPQKSAN